MNSFGGAAAATGFLAKNKKLSRPDYADGALRTGAGEDRWCSDAFELRPLEAARTTTRIGYKLGADVNRLRSDVFVLRILALPNVRGKLATTAWRAGQQAQKWPQAMRLMASAARRWSSA